MLITIEYQVDPDRAAEFRELMLTEGRSGRLRHGALSWELLHDINTPESALMTKEIKIPIKAISTSMKKAGLGRASRRIGRAQSQKWRMNITPA